MWDHLKKLYRQTIKAREFYLDTKLAKYTQGDRTIQEYYSDFLNLWNEKDFMALIDVPTDSVVESKLNKCTTMGPIWFNQAIHAVT